MWYAFTENGSHCKHILASAHNILILFANPWSTRRDCLCRSDEVGTTGIRTGDQALPS